MYACPVCVWTNDEHVDQIRVQRDHVIMISVSWIQQHNTDAGRVQRGTYTDRSYIGWEGYLDFTMNAAFFSLSSYPPKRPQKKVDPTKGAQLREACDALFRIFDVPTLRLVIDRKGFSPKPKEIFL